MKIIDSELKGNVVRFYLGEDPEFCGDDWNDYSYEDNAGPVYDRYIKEIVDYAIPFDCIVLEPGNGQGSGSWCRNDMKFQCVPMLVVVDDDPEGWGLYTFEQAIAMKDSRRIYMNTEFKEEDFAGYTLLQRKAYTPLT